MASNKKYQRPLSRKKRGYLLATLGGFPGGPIGFLVSPLVLFGLSRIMKEKDGQKPNIFKRWALIGIVGAPLCFSTHTFLENQDFQRKVNRCNDGRDKGCETLLESYSSRLKTSKSDREKVTNPIFITNFEKFKAKESDRKAEAAKLAAIEKQKKEAAQEKANAKYRAETCIENKGGDNCLGIKTELIDADLLAKAQPYIDTQKSI